MPTRALPCAFGRCVTAGYTCIASSVVCDTIMQLVTPFMQRWHMGVYHSTIHRTIQVSSTIHRDARVMYPRRSSAAPSVT